MEKNKKILLLEVLRGGACFLVFLNHFSAIFYPELVFYDGGCKTFLDKVWHGSPLNAITNGNISVQFFFVLSGYLQTKSIIDEEYIKVSKLWKKMLKLYSITTPAILLAFVLDRMGFMFHLQAFSYCEKLDYVSNYYTFYPSVASCLKDIFKVLLVSGSKYVTPLWTMSTELLGSCMMIFLSYSLFFGLTRDLESKRCTVTRISAYSFCMLLFSHLDHNFCSFLVGGMVYELQYATDEIKKLFVGKLRGIFWILGFYLATINGDCAGIYILLKPLSNYIVIIRGIGVGILLLEILLSDEWQRKLNKNGFWVNIGRISSYIYAFHWPVLFSLGCGIFVMLHKYNYYMSTILIGVICFALTVILSAMYMAIKKKVGNILMAYWKRI